MSEGGLHPVYGVPITRCAPAYAAPVQGGAPVSHPPRETRTAAQIERDDRNRRIGEARRKASARAREKTRGRP